MPSIRSEQGSDRSAVFGVHARAFPSDAEARLVDALRAQASPLVSLVAELSGEVVGHVLFSPVSVGGGPYGASSMGLAPVSVLPEHQGRGVGSALVRAGLAACAALGTRLVFVLGHRDYYPRFGFTPAADHGLHYAALERDAPFFALELVPGALSRASGRVEYHPLFSSPGT